MGLSLEEFMMIPPELESSMIEARNAIIKKTKKEG